MRSSERVRDRFFRTRLDFSQHLWSFVDGKTIVRKNKSEKDFRATSPESDALSKDLKKRGFSFVGSTIVYAFMQAVGMYNDHVVTCFRHKELLTPRN